MNRKTDVDIPKSVWSSWIPVNGERKLCRALTDDERLALEKRRDQLAPWVAGFEGRDEENQVALALADLFGSFRSMRQSGSDMVAQVDITQRLLAPFPAWAIKAACRDIQMHGVWRNGLFDRQWPPNDSEIIDEVRKKLRLYGDQHRSAVALLTAEVEA